jgi:hypothetical protein
MLQKQFGILIPSLPDLCLALEMLAQNFGPILNHHLVIIIQILLIFLLNVEHLLHKNLIEPLFGIILKIVLNGSVPFVNPGIKLLVTGIAAALGAQSEAIPLDLLPHLLVVLLFHF